MQTEKVADHIVNWLKEYANKAGMPGFVIGISGGIDSALTSTLCAMTGLELLCVEMPIHQDPRQVSRGKEHIAQLKSRFPNVRSAVVDLTTVFEEMKAVLPAVENSEQLNLSLANTRARLRMSTLYYFAGLHRYLVAGTGNKVEDFGVGFFTKYGDGGVDLSPIADLMKSEVRALAAQVQVPESILVAKPTDGLWGDDRTDEDQIGATYDQLEWAMKQDALDKNVSDFIGEEQRVFFLYKKLNNANLHKMNPIPICNIPFQLMN